MQAIWLIFTGVMGDKWGGKWGSVWCGGWSGA